MVKFRNLQIERLDGKDQRSVKDSRLSFRKLANIQSTQPQAETGSRQPINAKNRKILYEKASEYLNEVLNAVRERKGFALTPGFQIIKQIADDDDFMFQIDSEEKASWMWGDCGIGYFGLDDNGQWLFEWTCY